jgi:ribosomal-protein-alanine N-acetyltransferase
MTERRLVSGSTYLSADLAKLCYQLADQAYPQGAPWRQVTFAADIVTPQAVYNVLSVDQRPIGFMSMTTVLDETEITNIAILPAFRHRGQAQWLLTTVLDQLNRPGKVFLEVRQSNQAARRLYDRCGFEPLSVRRAYYHDPTEDALIMRKIMN